MSYTTKMYTKVTFAQKDVLQKTKKLRVEP